MPDQPEAVTHLCWDPWGLGVVAGTLAGEVLLVDRQGHTNRVADSGSPVTALRWSPKGTEFASGHHDGTLLIGDGAPDNWRTARYRDPVWCLAWAPDATAIAVGAGSDLQVLTPDGSLLDEFCFQSGNLHSLCWAPGPGMLAAGATGSIRWFNIGVDGPPEAVVTLERSGAVTHMALDDRSRMLACGDLRGSVEVHDLWSGDVFSLDGLEDRVRGLGWAPGSDFLVIAVDRHALVWPRDHEGLGSAALSCSTHDDTVTAVVAHPSGHWFASASWDGTVLVAEAASGDLLARITVEDPVRCLDWSPDGEHLAYGTNAGAVVVAETTALVG